MWHLYVDSLSKKIQLSKKLIEKKNILKAGDNVSHCCWWVQAVQQLYMDRVYKYIKKKPVKQKANRKKKLQKAWDDVSQTPVVVIG